VGERKTVPSLLDRLDPTRAAVLVVDLQNDFCHPAGAMAMSGADVSSTRRVLAGLGAFLEAARGAGATVVFVTLVAEPGPLGLGQQLVEEVTGRPAGRMCRAGSWGAALHPAAVVKDGDLSVVKRRYSAFAGTDLEAALRQRDIEYVVVIGTTANVCVQATAMDAYLRDFGVVVAEDLVGFTRPEAAEAALTNLASYYGVVCRADDLVTSWRRRTLVAQPGLAEDVARRAENC
jgi:ureidoacrylate peracid hydrolase